MTSGADSMTPMDNTAAQPQTWVKVPFNGGVIRSQLFETRHLTALQMAQALKSDKRRVELSLGLVRSLVGDDAYADVVIAVMDGEVDTRSATSGLLEAIVNATKAYREAQEPAPLDGAASLAPEREAGA